MRVEAGTTAPDFALSSHLGHTVRLSSFRGQKNVVIAFHPLAFTPVCASQMQNYEADKVWFDEHGTHVLGLSVDAVPAKAEWAKALGGISFDLLADFHPKGAMAQSYGVYLEKRGLIARSTVIIDKQGVVRYATLFEAGGRRYAADLLAECQKINNS